MNRGYLFASTVAGLIAPISGACAVQDWPWESTTLEGRWLEVTNVADSAALLSRAPAKPLAKQLFDQAAKMTVSWIGIYMLPTRELPSSRYVYSTFTCGVYWHRGEQYREANRWYAESERAVEILPAGEDPRYDGQSIRELLRSWKAGETPPKPSDQFNGVNGPSIVEPGDQTGPTINIGSHTLNELDRSKEGFDYVASSLGTYATKHYPQGLESAYQIQWAKPTTALVLLRNKEFEAIGNEALRNRLNGTGLGKMGNSYGGSGGP